MIQLHNYKPYSNFWSSNWCIAWAEKKNNTYTQISKLVGCRTWLSDMIFTIKTEKDYGLNAYNRSFDYNFPNIKHGKTCIVLTTKNTVDLTNLNKLEKQYKIPLTIIHETQHMYVYIVEGSKYWKDSCWKLTVWTLLIKHACGAGDYINDFTKNSDMLLRNIKMKPELEIFSTDVYSEHLNNYNKIHGNHGFVAICMQHNKPMWDLLCTN